MIGNRHLQIKSRPNRQILSASIAAYLYLVSNSELFAEDYISAKWQDYNEDDDRIRVISRYLGFEKQINASLALKGHGVNDVISGATPLGTPSEDEGETVPLSNLADERNAGVVDLVWTQGASTTNFQYSYSKESDFLSKGYSISRTTEFNKRNTGVSVGVSFIDDDVEPAFFLEKEEKTSWDFFVGLSQVVNPNTVVTLNYTYSVFDGYLNDPYKSIQQETEILPGLTLPLAFSENRPGERLRRIWFSNIKTFVEPLNGSLDVDFRYFSDSWGIDSTTLGISWYQKIGEKWIVRPNVRLYDQSAADFYYVDLEGVDFTALDVPDGSAPNYSSDYRLAELQTFSYGLKLVYQLNDHFHFDVAYERYEMEGQDGITSQAAFPDANITTLGARLWF
ncbi:DUF3570 domain-containing protein [Puniceicoccaceae bacterium K14]|nr:DUF3570 domain-containing protein [Puniceicoccaceae bacterium K14]